MTFKILIEKFSAILVYFLYYIFNVLLQFSFSHLVCSRWKGFPFGINFSLFNSLLMGVLKWSPYHFSSRFLSSLFLFFLLLKCTSTLGESVGSGHAAVYICHQYCSLQQLFIKASDVVGTLAKAVHMMDRSTSPGAFPLQWDEIGWCWEMKPFPSRSVPAIHSKSEGRGSYYQPVAASCSLGILWLGEPHPSFLSTGPQLPSANVSYHGVYLRGNALGKMN